MPVKTLIVDQTKYPATFAKDSGIGMQTPSFGPLKGLSGEIQAQKSASLGDFTRGRYIGEGGCGQVYRYSDLKSDQPLAVKIIRYGDEPEKYTASEAVISQTLPDRIKLVKCLGLFASSKGGLRVRR